VCFRAHPAHFKTEAARSVEEAPNEPHWSRDVEYVEDTLDIINEKLLEEVNRRGKVFLSHTKLRGRFTLRLSIGNIRTTRDHIKLVWDELNAVLNGTI
jgi:aromatic-L-amino-acid decarboxylase